MVDLLFVELLSDKYKGLQDENQSRILGLLADCKGKKVPDRELFVAQSLYRFQAGSPVGWI